MSKFRERFADYQSEKSAARKFRSRRVAFFRSLIQNLNSPVQVLDVGGTEAFWDTFESEGKPELKLTILNQVPVKEHRSQRTLVQGDARDLSRFQDNQFEVVFSNSVIEHVGDWEDQKRMASEIRRVGKRYFVQTPNFFFPMEPHFLFPFFQFLPLGLRAWLIQHYNLGWRQKQPDLEKALAEVRSVRLLKQSEVEALFPGATLTKEVFLGMTKSFILHQGFQS